MRENDPILVKIVQDDKQGERPASLSTILKDEILLISFLVLFVGIISTDVYYSTFGVRYQFLNIPPFHIVYRGLTILIHAPYLLSLYLVVIIWLWIDSYIIGHRRWATFLKFRGPSSYLLIILLLVGTYFMARHAGRRNAEQDMRENTSTLPEVVYMKSIKTSDAMDDEDLTAPDINYRLLLIDGDYVVLFIPLKVDDRGALPNIKRISKGDIHVIETNR